MPHSGREVIAKAIQALYTPSIHFICPYALLLYKYNVTLVLYITYIYICVGILILAYALAPSSLDVSIHHL